MTLVSIQTDLQKARQAGYGIPLFNVFDNFGVDGVFEALEERRAPTILGFYTKLLDKPNARALTEYIRVRAQETEVPVSLMLDHGESPEHCLRALDLGFSDVMYDGSRLSVDENIVHTRRIVEAARGYGAGVEAELGHVGEGDSYDLYGSRRLGFTDPELVESFVQATGVDALAIAFGNAHGLYKGEPRLDLNLVREISQRVDIPLVMHGGTGLKDQQYPEVIAAGISKINIATVILNTAVQGAARAANEENASIFTITEEIQRAYRECCRHFYDVFGTTGKG